MKWQDRFSPPPHGHILNRTLANKRLATVSAGVLYPGEIAKTALPKSQRAALRTCIREDRAAHPQAQPAAHVKCKDRQVIAANIDCRTPANLSPGQLRLDLAICQYSNSSWLLESDTHPHVLIYAMRSARSLSFLTMGAKTIFVPGMYFFGLTRNSYMCLGDQTMPESLMA